MLAVSVDSPQEGIEPILHRLTVGRISIMLLRRGLTAWRTSGGRGAWATGVGGEGWGAGTGVLLLELWRIRGSNPWPIACKAIAIPS